jgi:hypothetical protein
MVFAFMPSGQHEHNVEPNQLACLTLTNTHVTHVRLLLALVLVWQDSDSSFQSQHVSFDSETSSPHWKYTLRNVWKQ